MSLFGQIKETCLMGLFNLALPTSDTYSDLALVVELFIAGHYKYGCSLLGPFLVTYLSSFLDWFRNRKEEAWIALVAVLLNFYPQYKGN